MCFTFPFRGACVKTAPLPFEGRSLIDGDRLQVVRQAVHGSTPYQALTRQEQGSAAFVVFWDPTNRRPRRWQPIRRRERSAFGMTDP